MTKHHIAVHSLVDEQTLVIEDQSVWATPIQELSYNVSIISPLRAELTFHPQEEGCLISGSLTGEVMLPCNRCAEKAHLCIDVAITSFEPFPLVSSDDNDDEIETDPDLDVTVFITTDEVLHFNVAMFLWEEFVLALPIKPLCSETCKGLCTVCGTNLNTMQCACNNDKGDSRLAALCGLVVQKKDSPEK